MTEIDRRPVAIVDDDDAVRDSLRFLLEVMGYRVATFASAAEFTLPSHSCAGLRAWHRQGTGKASERRRLA
jgi:CheY-like chemotaxis protein